MTGGNVHHLRLRRTTVKSDELHVRRSILRRSAASVAVLLTVVGSMSHAQSANELLQRVSRRLGELRSIVYRIEEYTADARSIADVLIERGHDFKVFESAKIRVHGARTSDTQASPFSFAYDGTRFQYYDVRKGEVVNIDDPAYAVIGRSGLMPQTMLALAPYWQRHPLRDLLHRLVRAERGNDTTINGVACYSITSTITIENEVVGKRHAESVWYLDKQRLLVCGLVTSASRQYLSISSVDAVLDESSFSISAAGPQRSRSGKDTDSEGLLKLGTQAPLWTLASSTGQDISLMEMKGKVVLLDFWGTWCAPCLRSMPMIQAIHDHFGNNPKVQVLGVSVEAEDHVDPVEFMKRKQYTYPTVLGGAAITEAYQVHVFPTIYVIDQNGVIIHAEHGSGREGLQAFLIGIIERALAP